MRVAACDEPFILWKLIQITPCAILTAHQSTGQLLTKFHCEFKHLRVRGLAPRMDLVVEVCRCAGAFLCALVIFRLLPSTQAGRKSHLATTVTIHLLCRPCIEGVVLITLPRTPGIFGLGAKPAKLCCAVRWISIVFGGPLPALVAGRVAFEKKKMRFKPGPLVGIAVLRAIVGHFV